MKAALLFVAAVALVAIALAGYSAITSCSDCGENRFWHAPMIEVAQEDPGAHGARLRIAPNMDVRAEELAIEFDDTVLTRVDRAPRPGEWAIEREDGWLLGDAILANDVLVVGGDTPLAGSRVRLIVLPCNCYVSPYEGTVLT